MLSFSDILDLPGTSITPPKPYPVGTYVCIIDGVASFNQVGEKKTDAIDFNAKILQPHTDVDPQQLAEVEGGMAGKTIKLRFFISKEDEDKQKGSLNRLKTFLVNHLGIDESLPLKQMIASAPGRQVYVLVKHRSVIEGTDVKVYTDVAGTAKI